MQQEEEKPSCGDGASLCRHSAVRPLDTGEKWGSWTSGPNIRFRTRREGGFGQEEPSTADNNPTGTESVQEAA